MAKKKRSVAKRIVKKRGSSKTPLLIVIIAVATALIIGGMFAFSKFKESATNGLFAERPKITQPTTDMGRARQMTLYPDVENIMQVTSRDNIEITLIVPKGAIEKEITIQMIPYYYDAKTDDPSAGVLIGPGELTFNVPVTVLFDLEKSPLRTDGPENKKSVSSTRMTGKSQVLMIDQNATELIPTLVAREVETATQLRARILTGGGYVISVNGKDQTRWAKNAMEKEDMNAITILEASNVLLSSEEGLSKEEQAKARAAAQKILEKKIPPPHEMFAAFSVLTLLEKRETSLIPQSYAQNDSGYIAAQASTPQQVIALLCKSNTGLRVEEYLAYAAAAKGYGLNDLHDKCVTVAGNKAIKEAERLLNDPKATISQMQVAARNLQFIGIDDLTDLDQKLWHKIEWKAQEDAKKVAYDLDATSQQMAAAMQMLKDAGISEGPVQELLHERFIKELEETGDSPPPPPPPSDPVEHSYNEQQIMYDQAMTMIGIEFLKVMGFTDFSQEGVKKKLDEMQQGAEMMAEAGYTLCKELGGDNCDSTYAESKRLLQKAQEESYRVTSEIGKLENKAFETPDYDDEGASYYYELTPTPDEEYYMNINEEDNTDDGTEEYNELEVDDGSYDEGYYESYYGESEDSEYYDSNLYYESEDTEE